MNRSIPFSLSDNLAAPAPRQEVALGWAAGLGFTFVLFLGMAHFENLGTTPPATGIEDLRVFSAPLEAPPPPPRTIEPVPPPEQALPFAGIDVGASDSTVRIAVVPPDLEALVPVTREPPRALVQFSQLHTEFKPRMDLATDVRRVYQVSEVDQPPQALVRVTPSVPRQLFGEARALRVVLLLLVDTNGRAASVRIAQSSGQPEFDAIVAQTVREGWEFSPAIRRGRKVKCFAQQNLSVTLPGGSPYEIP